MRNRMKKDNGPRKRYETPRTRVKDIQYENCILSEKTLDGSAGEDAGDELYPGF